MRADDFIQADYRSYMLMVERMFDCCFLFLHLWFKTSVCFWIISSVHFLLSWAEVVQKGRSSTRSCSLLKRTVKWDKWSCLKHNADQIIIMQAWLDISLWYSCWRWCRQNASCNFHQFNLHAPEIHWGELQSITQAVTLFWMLQLQLSPIPMFFHISYLLPQSYSNQILFSSAGSAFPL